MSMTSRDTFLHPNDTVIAAPGPGQYDPMLPRENIKVGTVDLQKKTYVNYV